MARALPGIVFLGALLLGACGGSGGPPKLDGKWKLVKSSVSKDLMGGNPWNSIEFRGNRLVLGDGTALKYELANGRLHFTSPGHASDADLTWKGDTLVTVHDGGLLELQYEYLPDR